MNKEFVPYEIALALKELGFDEPCFVYWVFNNVEITFSTTDNRSGWSMNGFTNSQMIKKAGLCTAPIFSQVFRWFREKYNLFCEIQIDRTTDPKFFFDIYQYEHFGNYKEIRIGEWYLYRTYEEAELECLKKLIEIVKK